MKFYSVQLAVVLSALGLTQGHIEDVPGVKWPTLDGTPVKLISHRGMKAQQPQHTLGSYWLAALNGADYLEPDLVLTKDGVPVCYHDLHVEALTDVAERPEFAHLKKTFVGKIDVNDKENSTIKDAWFVSDFTLKELQTLRVKQQVVGVRPQFYNHLFTIPSLQQFLDNAHHLSYLLNKPINIAPEIKSSIYHSELRPSNKRYFEDKVLSILKENGYPLKKSDKANCKAKIAKKDVTPVKGKCMEKEVFDVKCGSVALQNFDYESLKYTTTYTDKHAGFEHVLLNEKNPWIFTPTGIQQISKYAQVLSFRKDFLWNGSIEDEFIKRNFTLNAKELNGLGGLLKSADLVKTCHKNTVKVFPYTFYDSRETPNLGCMNQCLPIGNTRKELKFFFNLGVDGIFIENLAEGVQLRTEYHTELRFNQPHAF